MSKFQDVFESVIPEEKEQVSESFKSDAENMIDEINRVISQYGLGLYTNYDELYISDSDRKNKVTFGMHGKLEIY